MLESKAEDIRMRSIKRHSHAIWDKKLMFDIRVDY